MKKLFILIILYFSYSSIGATHIIGGDLYVEYISENTFSVTLVMFRDCNPGNFGFPDDLMIQVFEEGTNNPLDFLDFQMHLGSVNAIPLGNACFMPAICLERGSYQLDVEFPDNPNGYYLSYQSCCRNDLIQNILDPSDVGMVFTCTFPDPLIENSSPIIGDYPYPGFFCVNGANVFDLIAYDADGDSLVYLLDEPLIGTTQSSPGSTAAPKPYDTVNWISPFSATDMIGGSPPMSLNPETGILNANPNMLFVFVFALKVEEFRNGVKIGEVRRELEFDALSCLPFEEQETCDGLDNNCNGVIDEGLPLFFYFPDGDNDGVGNSNDSISTCLENPPFGYGSDGTDCNDSDDSIYPGAEEIPNDGIDQDCDGSDLITGGLTELFQIGLTIYPNPAKDHFVIENNGQDKILEFNLTDVKGKKVFEGSLLEQRNEISVSTLDQGMYFVTIQNENVRVISKVIISK